MSYCVWHHTLFSIHLLSGFKILNSNPYLLTFSVPGTPRHHVHEFPLPALDALLPESLPFDQVGKKKLKE